MKNLLIAFTASAALCQTVSAQIPGTYISAETPDGRRVQVTAVTDNIVRVTNTLPGSQPALSRASVVPDGCTVPTISDNAEFSTITVPGGITALLRPDGRLLIDAGENKIITDNGLRTTAGGDTRLVLGTTSRGSVYGAGERGHKLNLRGDTLVMYNRQNYGYTGSDPRISQMNITMPLFLSSDGYAIVFDDFAPAKMVVDDSITYTTASRTPVSYYFVNGAATLADVAEQLTTLTGRQELPPLWSLGYITSKYGYRTQEETEGVIDTLKHEGYPVDGIVLDLYWYGKEQDMGRLAWDPEQWPDPEKMLARLNEKNVHLIPISQPYVLRNGRGLANYNELAPLGMFMKDSVGNPCEVKIWVGEGGMFDVSNPDTQAWLRQRYKALTDMGVSGWWGDLGEPEVHPESGIHANGLTAPEYHNQYGNDWSKIIYDLFNEQYPDRRLMTLMRGGTTGLQRYSVFPWSTDVSRSWGGLEPQVRIMLNSGLSGLGYMGHDVGGFAVDEASPYMPELYVRWLQLGLFSPVLRTHAQQYAEPYKYPMYADIIRNIINERYRWLPYNYTLAWENASKGLPLVRPLNFTEPGRTYDDITDEYLWGSEVLVAPVITEGATSRKVTFPAGTWVDYAHPWITYPAYSTIEYEAPLSVLPLFVKAGAFIPTADYKMQNTTDYNPARLTINYYPANGIASEFTMFDDDRVTRNSIDRGEYRLIKLEGDGNRTIKVSATGTYPGAPTKIKLSFVINNATTEADVNINGHSVKSHHDAEAHTLTFDCEWNTSEPLTIKY